MAKNPRKNSFQSSITNLQLPTILPAKISSRTLHHPANPLHPFIIMSHSLSTVSHHSSQILQSSHITHCTTSVERPSPRIPQVFGSSIIIAYHPSSSISGSSIYLPSRFPLKLKSHLFKNSYPESSDPPPFGTHPKRQPL